MTITIGELCMGYGGLGMGLSLALGGDTRVAWAVEYDKHPSAIITRRYPGVRNYGDVKTAPWADMEPVDWLTAGYPCQPFSHAGLRKGADDPRHLWPGVATAISVLRPRNVLLENVRGHLRLGFDAVLGDLAALGYDARWGLVRAADAGAPHNRARLFIVATDARGQRHGSREDARGLGRLDSADAGEARQRQRARGVAVDRGAAATGDPALRRRDASAHADGSGGPAGAAGGSDSDLDWGFYTVAIQRWERILGRAAPAPTAQGRLSARFAEWLMGLPEGWVTDVPGLPRNAQLKALGNGVVPQQAALACRLLGVTAEAVAA